MISAAPNPSKTIALLIAVPRLLYLSIEEKQKKIGMSGQFSLQIAAADLYARNFFPMIGKIRSAPEPAGTLEVGGAELIAKELLAYCSS